MDLADLRTYKNENDGVQYLQFAIDCFSKKASVLPLKSKEGARVKRALETVFKELGEPEKIQVEVDRGKEIL